MDFQIKLFLKIFIKRNEKNSNSFFFFSGKEIDSFSSKIRFSPVNSIVFTKLNYIKFKRKVVFC